MILDGYDLGDLWKVKYKEAREINSIVKATSQDLLYEQDGDGYNLLEENLRSRNPEHAIVLDL